jgi:hypothetical protein
VARASFLGRGEGKLECEIISLGIYLARFDAQHRVPHALDFSAARCSAV